MRHPSISSTFFAVLLLAISLLPSIQAEGSLGCVTTAAVSAKATGSAAIRKTSQADCNSYCSTTNSLFTYAVYSLGALTGNNCFCLQNSNFIDASAWSTPTGTSVLCNAVGVAAIVDIRTTFVYSTCYAPSSLLSGLVNTVTGTLGIGVSSPDQCFQQCSGSAGAYVAPYISLLGLGPPTYGCVCAGPGVSVTGVATSCGIGNFIAFTHPAAAAASNLARRQVNAYTVSIAGRKEIVREMEERAKSSQCPKGMKACLIAGLQDAWECVDPKNDLESCGGCPFGDYIAGPSNFNATATGQDCTALPGIYRGSATCSNGICQALACKKGWTLLDGICTPLLTL